MWLLCALVLSQAEPSAPPLVPLDVPIPPPGTEAPAAPPPPPDPGLAPGPVPGVTQPEPAYDMRRVGITGLVAAGVVGLGLSGTVLGVKGCGNDGTCQAAIAVAGIPLTWIASGLGGWLVHRAIDGQGSYASAMAGASIGAGAAATAWLVATSFSNGSINDGGLVALTTLTAVFLGAGVGFMAELSNIRTINEYRAAGVSVALLPGKGGATLSLGGRF